MSQERRAPDQNAPLLERKQLQWDGGSAALVDEPGPYGDFSATPRAHYAQFAMRSGGGRHVCGWNGRTVFDGEYTDGLLTLTPAGETLEGHCRARWRRVLLLRLEPTFLERALHASPHARQTLRSAIAPVDSLTQELVRAIAAECASGARNGTLYAETAATFMSLHLARRYCEGPRATPAVVRGGLAPRVLRLVQDRMQANLGEDVSLAELAALADLSLSHFCRAFKASTGQAPHQWRNARRLEHAKELLADPRLPIAHIALACGFGTQSHFGAVFKARTGVSPAAWRRR